MHWTSLGRVHGGTVEVKMDLYQPREIAKFGGRAMGVRTRMHIFSDSGGIQNSPGAGGYHALPKRSRRWRVLYSSAYVASVMISVVH